MNTGAELYKDLIITNNLGIHARAAAKISQIAQNASSGIWIQKDDIKVDASSIIDILTLECTKGSRITVMIEDLSDIEVLNHIASEIESGFGE